MNTLWFAFVIYIAGMAAVLYFRPSLMFDGGTWKEFGLAKTNNNTTIFPFWMFVILWSITSYVVGTMCVIGFSGLSGLSSTDTTENLVEVVPEPITKVESAPSPKEAADLEFQEIAEASKEMEEELNEMKPIQRRRKAKKPKKPVPGYYVKGIGKGGKSTYVYYGTEPPGY